jgi:hypothetical protein
MQYIDFDYYLENIYNKNPSIRSDPFIEGLVYGSALGIKSCIMVFIFI